MWITEVDRSMRRSQSCRSNIVTWPKFKCCLSPENLECLVFLLYKKVIYIKHFLNAYACVQFYLCTVLSWPNIRILIRTNSVANYSYLAEYQKYYLVQLYFRVNKLKRRPHKLCITLNYKYHDIYYIYSAFLEKKVPDANSYGRAKSRAKPEKKRGFEDGSR